MQKHVLKGVMALLATLVLASCSSSPVTIEPKLTFAAPVHLNFSEIKIDDQQDSEAVPPFSETARLSERLRQALDTWSHTHLLSAGGSDVAYLVINQAVLKEVRLPQPEGISGAFTEAPSERYEGEIDVRLETRDAHGFTARAASAQVKQTRFAYAKMTLTEREALWDAIINNMLVTLDQALKQRISHYLGSFVDMVP